MKLIKIILAIGVLGLVGCNQAQEERAIILDSECDISVEQEFHTDIIISKFQLELQNENTASNFSDIIESTLSTLEKSKENSDFLWPYSKIDSAHYETYEPFDGNMENHDLEDREIEKILRLCDKKTTALLNLVNNPNYFSYGECGTQIPEAQIKFHYGGKVVGEISFSCSHGQTSFTPENNLNKFGGLNELGNKLLHKIKPWE